MKTSLAVLLGLLIIGVSIAIPKHSDEVETETTVTLQEVEESKPSVEVENTIKIKNLNLMKEDLTFLTSEVSQTSVDLVINDINKFNLQSNKKPIFLLLDSPGGSVLDGERLITTMEASKRPVVSINLGLCASMCFMILEHSSKRLSVDRAILMAHGASVGVMYQGKLDELVSRYTFLKRKVDKMDKYIAKRAGMTYQEFKAKSQEEYWTDARDALNQHLLDEIVSVQLPSVSEAMSSKNKLKESIRLE